jgi:hypothetical protein
VTYEGDSGNRIFVLYWRCSLISVSVIRGSTVVTRMEKKTEKPKASVDYGVSFYLLYEC